MPDLVIDLGDVREVAEDEAVSPKWTFRRVAPYLSMLTVTILAAASPPPSVGLTHVATFPSGTESILLLDGGLVRRDGEMLVALELDGTERWRATIDPAPQEPGSMRSEGDVLMVRGVDPTGSDFRSTALDPATGRLLWQLAEWVERSADVLVQWGDRVVRFYELDGKSLRWETPVLEASALDSEAGAFFGVTPQGRLLEYDIATGEVRRSAQVMIGPEIQQVYLEPGDDYLMVVMFEPPESELTFAFDRLNFEAIDLADARWLTQTDCGPVICAIPRDHSAGTSILDRKTGIVLWPVPRSQTVVRAGVGDGLLIMAWSESPRERPALNLVDPRTRQLRRKASGWIVVTDEVTGDLTPIWLWRKADGRTVVASFASDGLRVLGSVPQRLSECQYAAPMLLCAVGGNTVGVWRVEL